MQGKIRLACFGNYMRNKYCACSMTLASNIDDPILPRFLVSEETDSSSH